MTNTRNLTKMALLIALTCVLAYVSFPNPMGVSSISALTIALCLIGLMLPPKEAFLTVTAYVLLGAIGLPVFVGGTAGLGKLLGPTGGFIWSWPIVYTLLSMWKGNTKSFPRYAVMTVLITIPLMYAIAVPWFMFMVNKDLWTSLVMVCFPFLLGDVLKAIFAAWVASKMKF